MSYHRRVRSALLSRLCMLAIAATPAVTSRPAAPAGADYYRQSSGDFFLSDAAERVIDLQAVDDAIIAAAIFHETNRVRGEHQLPALTHAPKLSAAADMHARDMVAGDFFAHENPADERRRQPIDRVRLAGYEPRFVAENIATAFAIRYEPGRPFYVVPGGVSYAPRGEPIEPHTYASFAEDLVRRWMDSPGHRANILSNEPTELGAATAVQAAKDDDGLATFHAVQNFGAPLRE